ncbi:SPFH/Band 7/PHB domain protein [Maribellus sp. CM-23]|uniref:SPFH domain-containing protein n=1 Tax=Maribellus sp. CM-23 TaxID=2781026 RepID=UPI001F1BECD7|nr:SPFH domain-containing protein [Maribellus sp. CM-23]MCE4566740.1 SPFH/Band 7/PHB domain protein [Maribellus sp. CM-23]
MNATTLILILLAIFVIVFAAAGIRIVQQSQTMIIERLGKYHRTLTSGINIIIPIIDQPRKIIWRYVREDFDGRKIVSFKTKDRIDLRETVYDFPKQNVITKDNVGTEINALLYFQIMDPIKALYEIENLPDAIEKLTQTTLRNVIGELDLDETLTSRDTINSKLRIILDDATNKWGVKVNRVELQDINPPRDIRDAMEKQMRAERDRRAKILEAEGSKKSMILEAEGFKESQINKAEGEKQAEILKAEGDAMARVRRAEGEAEAILKVTEAISKNGDPINYLVAMKYLETFKEMVSGQDNKTVYLPYEASGILSSIGGIKDLLKGS